MIKCKNCNAEIPPAFVHAIQSGICAGCGSELFSSEDKELLAELTEAMEKMPNNPAGIAGWLLSNYRFQKIGDAVPTEKFHDGSDRVQPQQQQQQPGMPNLKVANNPVQQMLARTGYQKQIQQTQSKVFGNDKLQQMAQEIASIGDDDMYGNMKEEPANEEYFDEDDGVVIERGPKNSRALVTGSNLVDANVPPLSPEEIEALSANSEPQDEESAHKALQMQRMKRLKAQQAVATGAGQGSFRRSG